MTSSFFHGREKPPEKEALQLHHLVWTTKYRKENLVSDDLVVLPKILLFKTLV